MPDYRRWYQPGGTYFFTVVTYARHRLFDRDLSRRLLGSAMRSVAEEMPWKTIAIVLLYDHLHVLWTLPPGDDDFSGRWQRIRPNSQRSGSPPVAKKRLSRRRRLHVDTEGSGTNGFGNT